MSFPVHDIVGITGSFFIVASYFLMQLGKMQADQTVYSVLNALGAGLILFSLANNFNLSAFIIEFFWLGISFLGIARSLKSKQPPNVTG
jgi:hypothetical protein